MYKPRVIVSLNCGWTIRNWVYTGILKKMAAHYELLVVSPVAKRDRFREILAKQGVPAKLTSYNTNRRSFASTSLGKIKNVLFNSHHDIETFNIEMREKTNVRCLESALLKLHRLPGLMGAARLAAAAERGLESDAGYRAAIAAFKPDFLISTHPFAPVEVKILREASRARVPILGSLLSWDNLSTKGMLASNFDHMLVWSPLQRRMFLKYYPRYRDSQVKITGIPHFDAYAGRDSNEKDREYLSIRLGISPRSRILLYCTSAEVLAPHEPQIIAEIAGWLDRGMLPADTHLLIRCHPHDRAVRYSRFAKPGRVSIFGSTEAGPLNVFNWIPPEDEIAVLTAMLKSSAICLNIASTTSIDAAACGIPVGNIGFDGSQNMEYGRSVRRFYDFTHYKDVVKTGGVRIAWHPAELLSLIKAYLANPALDSEERKRLVEDQCWKMDGRSAERTVEAIDSFWEEIASRGHA